MNIREYRAKVNAMLEGLEAVHGPDIEVLAWTESRSRYTEAAALDFHYDTVQASLVHPEPEGIARTVEVPYILLGR